MMSKYPFILISGANKNFRMFGDANLFFLTIGDALLFYIRQIVRTKILQKKSDALMGDCIYSSKRFRPDLDRSKSCLNPV